MKIIIKKEYEQTVSIHSKNELIWMRDRVNRFVNEYPGVQMPAGISPVSVNRSNQTYSFVATFGLAFDLKRNARLLARSFVFDVLKKDPNDYTIEYVGFDDQPVKTAWWSRLFGSKTK